MEINLSDFHFLRPLWLLLVPFGAAAAAGSGAAVATYNGVCAATLPSTCCRIC